jgi:hypothetical protein
MIDTLELSALMRQGTGMDEATADRIAQAILKAHEMSPPVTREYLDARLDATREHVDKQLAVLEARFEKALRGVAWSLWGSSVATIGLTLTGVFFLLTHFKP